MHRTVQGPNTDPESVAAIAEAMRTGTQAHVRLLNYRKDKSEFNNMLSLRPIFDRDGHMVFVVSITIEIVSSFARLKPLLAQVDRLNKLIPDTIMLPSPPSVHKRVSLVHHGMLLARAQANEHGAKRRSATEGRGAQFRGRSLPYEEPTADQHLQTAAEKSRAKALERTRAYKAEQKRRSSAAAAAAAMAGTTPPPAEEPPSTRSAPLPLRNARKTRSAKEPEPELIPVPPATPSTPSPLFRRKFKKSKLTEVDSDTVPTAPSSQPRPSPSQS